MVFNLRNCSLFFRNLQNTVNAKCQIPNINNKSIKNVPLKSKKVMETFVHLKGNPLVIRAFTNILKSVTNIGNIYMYEYR